MESRQKWLPDIDSTWIACPAHMNVLSQIYSTR